MKIYKKEYKNIITSFIKGRLTYTTALEKIFKLNLKDKKDRMRAVNNLKSARNDFIYGWFYPADLHEKKGMRVW